MKFIDWSLLCGLLLVCVGCSKRPAERASQVHVAPAAATPSIGADGRLDPSDPKHGTRRLVGLDAPVFVDGAFRAVLRYGELPVIPVIQDDARGRLWRVADYLEAIGVPIAAVKSIHFHGNADRIASVEGTELRKEKERFVFSFISGETGAPLQRWSTERLTNTFVIHEIRRVTVYVDKPSPGIHPQRQCHLGSGGGCTEEIPYATGELAKGTRVYLDGKMVGFVKRRQLGEALVVRASADGEQEYSLARLIERMGVSPSSIEHVELAAGDDVIARADGLPSTNLIIATYFTLPKHHHGKVRIHVPAEAQANEPGVTDKDALVSAVLLYRNTAPTARELVAISEDTDLSVRVATSDPGHGQIERREP